MATLNSFQDTHRLVIKIGSALLVDPSTGVLRSRWLENLSQDIAHLHQNSVDIVLVSSGAIALGRARLGLLNERLSLAQKQACAATGQSLLTQAYEKTLGAYNIMTAQALLTLEDTETRRRWLNARSTLNTLLDYKTVPIINENDTVATDEIRYGDNDRLAARSAQMLEADTLLLLSDIDGLYTQNPRQHADAVHIPHVKAITAEIMAMGGGSNPTHNMSQGGMATKLAAARIATQAGCSMCIMDGLPMSPLFRLMKGERCTWFHPAANPLSARHQWIKGSLNPKGTIQIDDGAAKALRQGKSLLAAGAIAISGDFQKGDAVIVETMEGQEIARGLIDYDCVEAEKILGYTSDNIAHILGYENSAVLIHANNMVRSRHE